MSSLLRVVGCNYNHLNHVKLMLCPPLDKMLRVILEFDRIFGQELVELHTRPSMFSKFLMHAWKWFGGLNKEHFYIASLAVKLILACQGVLK